MYCMKCGKEIDDSHVFCDDCLEVMSHHPVKKGTPVLLSNAATSAEKKPAPKQETQSQEPQEKPETEAAEGEQAKKHRRRPPHRRYRKPKQGGGQATE